METIIQWVVIICLPLIVILLVVIYDATSSTQKISLKVWEEIRKQNDEYRARLK